MDAELKQSGLNNPLTLISNRFQERILLGFEGVMRTGPLAGESWPQLLTQKLFSGLGKWILAM